MPALSQLLVVGLESLVIGPDVPELLGVCHAQKLELYQPLAVQLVAPTHIRNDRSEDGELLQGVEDEDAITSMLLGLVLDILSEILDICNLGPALRKNVSLLVQHGVVHVELHEVQSFVVFVQGDLGKHAGTEH